MYCSVNGIRMYYERKGEGDPVIMVHGNGESHDIFDVCIRQLEKTHTVYAVDSRCHGQSTDTKETGYDLLALDLICFIRELHIESPVFYGFSDGGIIGLLIAVKEPSLLKKLIISGANLNPFGLKMSCLLSLIPDALKGNKLFRLMLREPHIRPGDLRGISVPVAVLAGEKDCIRRSHTERIAENIPDSVLEILPGEEHGSYIVHSEKLYPIIKKYL